MILPILIGRVVVVAAERLQLQNDQVEIAINSICIYKPRSNVKLCR